ncbi:hypothetical protein [Streptomyces sp. NPDC088794]|uniref:hypothetical protein n=1 Tax=Streptomyces sp. NPDC088794 TaxID=3365902 RepID=UPI0038088F39
MADALRRTLLALGDLDLDDMLKVLYLQSCGNLMSFAPLKQLPLESVGLMDLPGIQDLDVLNELNLLSTLRLGPAEVTGLASKGIRLENIHHVSLTGDASAARLGSAVTAFPRTVSLRVLSGTELDLAPLAAHPTLRRVTTPPNCRLLKADRLPDTIALNPDRRTM